MFFWICFLSQYNYIMTSKKPKNTGKYFEGKSIETLKAIFPASIIHPEKQIPTTYGGFRKVDMGINKPGEYDYVVFECKDEKRTTSVGALGQAQDIMKDVGAGRCAILTNNKISKNAIKKAFAQDVDVFNIIDPKDEQIRPKLKVRVVTDFTWLVQYSYICRFAGQDMAINFPPEATFLSQDGSIHELVCNLWNEDKLSAKTGMYEYVHNKFNMVSAKEYGLISAPADDIKIYYEVTSNRFVNDTPLVKGVGLYDIKKKQFITASKEIAIGPMKIEDIAKAEHQTTKTPEELNATFVGDFKHVMVLS